MNILNKYKYKIIYFSTNGKTNNNQQYYFSENIKSKML